MKTPSRKPPPEPVARAPAPAVDSRAPVLVEPIHSAVPGRLRLHVGGLRGAPELKALLEQGVATHPSVREVTASTLTGNALVLFDPGLPSETIIDHTRAVLRREIAADTAEARTWHRIGAAEVCASLACPQDRGLTATTARRRIAEHGRNLLPEPVARSEAAMFAGQFLNLPVALLAGVGLFSLLADSVIETGAIAAVVVLNGVIGYVTESRAEHAIRSLGLTRMPSVRVMRDGAERDLPAEALVPGDLIALSRGDVVPADARLITAEGLSVSEAGLTGESVPVRKRIAAIDVANLPLGDRRNMVYRGSAVTGGSGSAIVVATGGRTEAGRVQRLVASADPPETPMQRQLGWLGRDIVWAAAGASALVLGLGLLRGLGLVASARSALSVAVAAVPEGLPMVATTALALGVRDMGQRDVHVRRLPALETLASVDTICFDKTGTLTLNDMSLAVVAFADRSYRATRGCLRDAAGEPLALGQDDRLDRLLQIGCLCSEAEVEEVGGRETPDGSATEEALLRAAIAHGIDISALRDRLETRAIRHRTEVSHFMGTIHERPKGLLAAVKGSPGEVLARCTAELGADGKRRPLTEARRADIERQNRDMAEGALRVLGFAYRDHAPDAAEDGSFRQLTWLGLAGLEDPVREGATDAIARLHAAGIRTIMLTGDQKATARAVLHSTGLNGTGETEVMDASDLETLSPAEVAAAVARVDAFARVSPAQKLAIVRALQAGGATVAMIGDGINDGPALRAADVGVAIGADGAAAREVADIYLDTDDLSTLLEAVARGRTTRLNARKAIRFLVATNLSEVLVMIAGTAAGQSAPLSPMQLLWINLISDVLPGIGLAGDPPPADVLAAGPLPRDAQLVGRGDLRTLLAEAGLLGAGAFAADLFGSWRHGGESTPARTVTFGSLILAQLLHALACRSSRGVITDSALPPNRMLAGILVGSLVLQSGAMLIPGLRRLLGVERIGPMDTAVMLAAGILPFLAGELAKGLAPPPPGPLRHVKRASIA
jgi:P-type Ca2+ transporter type 2C